MNKIYQNQGVPNNQQAGGVSGGQTQLPAQINLPLPGQAVQSQNGQAQTAPQSLQDSQQVSANQAPINASEITPEMRKTYESIFNSYGVDAANNWLKQQIVNNHINLQNDNAAVMSEIQAKYGDLYAIPSIRDAIQAYISKDLNPSISLRDQGFHHVVQHISNVYRSGHESGMNLKNQNDSAKARMTSAVNSAAPHYQSNKTFTRSEIKAMSPDEFVKNEKAIFDQLTKGQIK